MVDVFISYPRAQRALVEPIKQRLVALKLDVYFDVDGIDGGANFPDAIDRALRRSKSILSCWTPLYFERRWCLIECRAGIEKNALVPVALERFDSGAPPADLRFVNYFDLVNWRGEDEHEDWNRTLQSLGKHIGRKLAPALSKTASGKLQETAPAPPPPRATEMQAAIIADLRTTWDSNPVRSDLASVERFLEKVRKSAPGSGLEFEVETRLNQMRDAAKREAEEKQRRKVEERAREAAAREKAERDRIERERLQRESMAAEARRREAQRQREAAEHLRREEAERERIRQAWERDRAQRATAEQQRLAAASAPAPSSGFWSRVVDGFAYTWWGQTLGFVGFFVVIIGIGLVQSFVIDPVLNNNAIANVGIANLRDPPAPFVDLQAFADCSDCPEMVAFGGAEFTMGSSAPHFDSDRNEGPLHRVTVAPFAIGRYDVTFADWQKCVEGGGCGRNPTPSDYGAQHPNSPVFRVSWNDARDYAAWLSARTHQNYRLPTEAEWEYAARAGTTSMLYWADVYTNDIYDHGNFGEYADEGQPLRGAAIGRDQWMSVSPIGSFDPNPWGLYDMAGNVWQWVEDCYHDSYVGAPADGTAWQSENCALRVIRGGSWANYYDAARTANRGRRAPDRPSNAVGFRVARTL